MTHTFITYKTIISMERRKRWVARAAYRKAGRCKRLFGKKIA
jgi:hypothetical protein